MLFNRMRAAVDSILHAIHHHPFNLELAEGILPKNKFIFYLEQDALYLREYSRALALTGARLPEYAHAEQYMQFALSSLQAEKALQDDYLNQYKKYHSQKTEMNSTCFMYTHFLLSTASVASIEEASASLLPCFWVYREVGKKMLAEARLDNNPYRPWIMLYSGEEFDFSVETAIQIVNQLSEKTSSAMREKMLAAFMKATQLEWMFWDAAYHLETWPLTAAISFDPTTMMHVMR